METIALFGAAGAIGRSIADELRHRETPYRVVGRSRQRLEADFGADPLAHLVTWNPDDPASIRAAAEGIDTLIYLVGVPYNHFELHPILIERTLEAAIAVGVKRFVLIGTVYPYGAPQSATVTEQHPRNPHTFKGRMRKEQEDCLLKAHAEGRIEGTILRLPDFYGPGVEASFLHGLFQAAATGGTANMIGPIDMPHEFVYVPDVGPVVLDLAANPQAYGTWWNFAGAGAITQQQIAEKVFRLAGRKPRLRVAGKTMLRLLGLFNPFMREFVEMHYLLTTPLLMDDTALHRLLGSVHKTSYADGLRETLSWYQRAAQ
ncbi:MAG TPA: NAD-dependent epimerase/dehydratase family protein [Granulicella sp.]